MLLIVLPILTVALGAIGIALCLHQAEPDPQDEQILPVENWDWPSR